MAAKVRGLKTKK